MSECGGGLAVLKDAIRPYVGTVNAKEERRSWKRSDR